MTNRTPSRIRDRLLGADLLLLLDDGTSIVGFATTVDYPQYDMLYLDGIVLLPQVVGVGSQMLQAICAETSFARMALTTQNPRMYCSARKVTKRMYPSPEERRVPEHLIEIANEVKGERGVLDLTTFVIRNLYESCRYETIPDSRDPQVDRWFADALAIRDGITCDGFVFVAEGLTHSIGEAVADVQ
jgi:hypothetical protein